ncbi:GntR family transcriptional regulator [Candidatus Galacturonibacter soehngenii]|nr:GntR family transcriptional regulator [Candidatus Galacturonibacter soehngenii]
MRDSLYIKCIKTNSTVDTVRVGKELSMIVIDYKDKRPIYEQIIEKYENLIIRGVLEGGSKLPSVRSLAIDLSINPNTIQKAYTELERSGYIYSVKGKGNYVIDDEEIKKRKKEAVAEQSKNLVRLVKSLGITKEEFMENLNYVFEEVGL